VRSNAAKYPLQFEEGALGVVLELLVGTRSMRDSLLRRYLRAPDHPGKLRVVRALARTVIPDTGIVAPAHDGIRLYLHPRDWIEYLLLRGESYEPLTLQFMRDNLRAGDGAVLAGVNFGLHVAIAAKAVAEAGTVVGVEPQPVALLRTRLNLELNDLQARVQLVAAALGRSPDLVPMAWSKLENTGAASLLDEGHGFVVPLIRLGDVIPLLAKRCFRLLLLDVQGFEEEALAGAELERGPDLMVVELDPVFLQRAGSVAGEIARRLTTAGYELFDLHGIPLGEDYLALPERNLVAARRGVGVRWAARVA
jgi:FkbM family methyltransferase